MTGQSPVLHFRDCVVQILSPHLGPAVARERANHVAQLWAFEPLDESSVARIIRAARQPCYGAVDVSDTEADSLAARVLLLVDGLR